MNIIAVVVTYNRMELLKRNIRCLQQNKPISSIVIVNNGSTDGTTEWLAAQEGLTVINQTNVGGAGGFYTGIQYAYQAGADWIWCMDEVDQVCNTLYCLLKNFICFLQSFRHGCPTVNYFQ